MGFGWSGSISEPLKSTGAANITSTNQSTFYHLRVEKMAMTARTATISRKTNETEIQVYINLDCQPGSASQQIIEVSTGIGFLDHVRPPTEPSIIFFLHTSRDQ